MDLPKERGAKVEYYDPYVPMIRPTREHPQFPGKVHCMDQEHYSKFRCCARRNKPLLRELSGAC
jgi:hypothetical protein